MATIDLGVITDMAEVMVIMATADTMEGDIIIIPTTMETTAMLIITTVETTEVDMLQKAIIEEMLQLPLAEIQAIQDVMLLLQEEILTLGILAI